MDVQDLQVIEDSYLVWLKTQLPTLPAVGSWNWPAYSLKDVSGVVLGYRQLAPSQYEIVYEVTLTSAQAIPHALEGMQEVSPLGNSSFTFLQLGNSIPVSGGDYVTKLLSTYIGPLPTARRATALRAMAPLAAGLDPPPHPPP